MWHSFDWTFSAHYFSGTAELGVCRNPRYNMGKPYIEEYLKHMPISEPVEDFDTRNAIYAMKQHVVLSIAYPQDPEFRQM